MSSRVRPSCRSCQSCQSCPSCQPGRSGPSRVPRARTLGTRLLVLVGAVLVLVCAVLAGTTALAQRAYLMGDLDDRVTSATERSLRGAAPHPDEPENLAFLTRNGHPDGMIAARPDAGGRILTAQVVGADPDTSPQTLTSAQQTALEGVATDGSPHTRTIPGLGTYRIAALDSDGVRVLAGLPMNDVQHMIGDLAAVDAAVAGAVLVLAGCGCALVVRRQLRPLGRVAATAAEVARAPLAPGEATGLPRVPERDIGYGGGSEVGQVGAALNRMIEHAESVDAERRLGEERVRRSEERMRRFLADASHELRTPLASIAGYAELMNRVNGDTGATGATWTTGDTGNAGGTGLSAPVHAWRRVSAESARMTELVEDLILLARLDEGRPARTDEVDMATLAAEAVWEARAGGGGHHWQLDLRLDAPALVLGDAVRLRQLLTNLLANARTHTPVGTTVVTVVEATAAHQLVRVRDDGPGIPPALLPSVFDRFTRADSSRSRTDDRGGGSGLGLAVAAAITEAHGGRIGVESVPGRTEFTVELPAADDTTSVPASSCVRPASV